MFSLFIVYRSLKSSWSYGATFFLLLISHASLYSVYPDVNVWNTLVEIYARIHLKWRHSLEICDFIMWVIFGVTTLCCMF